MKITNAYTIALPCLGISMIIGCAGISGQITSLNTDCKVNDITISDETVELNGEQSWIAKCNDKTYTCNYLPESGSDCFEIK